LHQRQPKLDRSLCTEIASYVFPLSIYKAAKQNRIEEIFQRINSNGKHLSQQELRQVGVDGLFPDLVRKLSCKIRGDVSHTDRLPFNEMNRISISNKDLDYGISVNEIFWIAQGIITYKNIRESRDEELVAHLLAYMILNDTEYKPFPTARSLNKFYGVEITYDNSDDDDDERNDSSSYITAHKRIEDELRKKTPEALEKQFMTVFKEIELILSSANSMPKLLENSGSPRHRFSSSRKGHFSKLIFGNRKIQKVPHHF
jgi:hypothetical protein